MIGDAISHSVLPGIVIAVMLSGSLSSFSVFLGAGIAGFVTVLLVNYLSKRFKVQNDASLGLTFTVLFALGVVMISFYAGDVHIDQECVLYGEITFLPLSSALVLSGNEMGPKTFYNLLANFSLILAILTLFYKEFKVSSFDPGFSSMIAVSPRFFELILLGMVSFTTVASFEAVGSILVISFLVASPLAAYQISKSLNIMILWTLLFGFLSAFLGYHSAVLLDTSISASMALVSGIIFAAIFALKNLNSLLQGKKSKMLAEGVDFKPGS